MYNMQNILQLNMVCKQPTSLLSFCIFSASPFSRLFSFSHLVALFPVSIHFSFICIRTFLLLLCSFLLLTCAWQFYDSYFESFRRSRSTCARVCVCVFHLFSPVPNFKSIYSIQLKDLYSRCVHCSIVYILNKMK